MSKPREKLEPMFEVLKNFKGVTGNCFHFVVKTQQADNVEKQISIYFKKGITGKEVKLLDMRTIESWHDFSKTFNKRLKNALIIEFGDMSK